MPRHPALPRPSTRAFTRAPLLLLLLVLPLGACSGSDADPRGDEPVPAGSAASTQPGEPTQAAVPTKHLVGRVAGRLPAPARKRLMRGVRPPVDAWMDAAYAAGTFPREITGAWSGFTAEAARRARRDRQLTSLGRLAERIDAVEVRKRAVRWTVLAPGGRPAGATARITLDVRTAGEVERTVVVRGRLALTRVRDEWRIFAYDLTRGDR